MSLGLALRNLVGELGAASVGAKLAAAATPRAGLVAGNDGFSPPTLASFPPPTLTRVCFSRSLGGSPAPPRPPLAPCPFQVDPAVAREVQQLEGQRASLRLQTEQDRIEMESGQQQRESLQRQVADTQQEAARQQAAADHESGILQVGLSVLCVRARGVRVLRMSACVYACVRVLARVCVRAHMCSIDRGGDTTGCTWLGRTRRGRTTRYTRRSPSSRTSCKPRSARPRAPTVRYYRRRSSSCGMRRPPGAGWRMRARGCEVSWRARQASGDSCSSGLCKCSAT